MILRKISSEVRPTPLPGRVPAVGAVTPSSNNDVGETPLVGEKNPVADRGTRAFKGQRPARIGHRWSSTAALQFVAVVE